ncbi:MAG: Flp pilus assembly complex ATPase component TadA [Planctomycetes bacterium]|nr:Flp pilus assembly complex ATPase component TadA [Planctomycetota bacterium]
MVFGLFGGKGRNEPEEEEDDVEPVSFLGPLNGQEVNLKANGRLVEAGLLRAKDLITDAMERRADSVRIDPKGAQSVVTIFVDGMPYPGGKLGKTEANAITQMLKLLSGLDIKERKTVQVGGIKAEFDEKKYTLGIKSIPVAEGERLLVRINDNKAKLETPSDLGMGEPMRLKLRELCQDPGVVLVCGPPNSGLSTSFFGVVRNIDAYIYTIYTICDLEGRSMIQTTAMDREPGETLDLSITKAARREANVLVCEPLKTSEVAKTMLARHESINMLAEMSAKDTASALLQLLEWVGDPALVAAGLKGILTQKLVRTLCSECKLAYKPKAEFLKKLGLPVDTPMLYRKPPEPAEGSQEEECEKCGGMGYYGRTMMFELLEISEGMKQTIQSKPDANAIRAQMRKDKMVTLQQDGLRLVAEGRTSLEELQRVFKPA